MNSKELIKKLMDNGFAAPVLEDGDAWCLTKGDFNVYCNLSFNNEGDVVDTWWAFYYDENKKYQEAQSGTLSSNELWNWVNDFKPVEMKYQNFVVTFELSAPLMHDSLKETMKIIETDISNKYRFGFKRSHVTVNPL